MIGHPRQVISVESVVTENISGNDIVRFDSLHVSKGPRVQKKTTVDTTSAEGESPSRGNVDQAPILPLQGLGSKADARPLLLDHLAEVFGLARKRRPEVQETDRFNIGMPFHKPRRHSTCQTPREQ